jgi:hypothetical protein
MERSPSLARHLALGLGVLETLAGIIFAGGIWLIAGVVEDPHPTGSALLIGIAIFAVCFPAPVMVLAMAHRKSLVIYACCAVLVVYPVTVYSAYSAYG